MYIYLCGLHSPPDKMREICVDVECVATGMGHNDRSVCWIGAVDVDGNVLLDVKIKVPNMYSPLTGITGVTVEMLEQEGVSREEGLKKTREVLGADVLLVGQKIQSDIDWLELKKGIDYGDMHDIAEDFKSYNSKYQRYDYCSLAQEAFVLLGVSMHGKESHSPIKDGIVTMQLYSVFVKNNTTKDASERISRMRRTKNLPHTAATPIDGVCVYRFNRNKCFCGQPTE